MPVFRHQLFIIFIILTFFPGLSLFLSICSFQCVYLFISLYHQSYSHSRYFFPSIYLSFHLSTLFSFSFISLSMSLSAYLIQLNILLLIVRQSNTWSPSHVWQEEKRIHNDRRFCGNFMQKISVNMFTLLHFRDNRATNIVWSIENSYFIISLIANLYIAIHEL